MQVSSKDSSYASTLKADAQFTMKASGHAFKIITKNLYSHPLAAVIRELSCNALDAHKAIGNDQPFEIIPPSAFLKQLTFRDYGVGMSHEQIMGVYTSYFTSTKHEDNEFIGGFGLGSKTPFAISDSFTVSSIHGGVKNDYLAFLDADGVPSIKHLSSEETDEHSGTTVTVPCDADRWRVVTTIKEQLAWFDRMPLVDGEDIIELRSDDLAEMRERGYCISRAHSIYGDAIRIGGIVYEVPRAIARPSSGLIAGGYVLVYDCPIGSFSIAPSREELSWDEESIAMYEKVHDQAITDIQSRLNAIIDDSKLALDERYNALRDERIATSNHRIECIATGMMLPANRSSTKKINNEPIDLMYYAAQGYDIYRAAPDARNIRAWLLKQQKPSIVLTSTGSCAYNPEILLPEITQDELNAARTIRTTKSTKRSDEEIDIRLSSGSYIKRINTKDAVILTSTDEYAPERAQFLYKLLNEWDREQPIFIMRLSWAKQCTHLAAAIHDNYESVTCLIGIDHEMMMKRLASYFPSARDLFLALIHTSHNINTRLFTYLSNRVNSKIEQTFMEIVNEEFSKYDFDPATEDDSACKTFQYDFHRFGHHAYQYDSKLNPMLKRMVKRLIDAHPILSLLFADYEIAKIIDANVDTPLNFQYKMLSIFGDE